MSNTDQELNRTMQTINDRLLKISQQMASSDISEYVQLMNSPRKLIFRNILAGIARGVGYAIGFSVFLVTSLYILRALGKLNLPIIGDYIADIVKIVQAQLERPY
jgi:hypothetical protein